jgi:hypothetical protein
MDKSLFFSRLSLSQRERIEVRDCSGGNFQWQTKSPEERYRALRGSDGSRIERGRFPAWPKIDLASGRAFPGADNHGPNHPVRWQVSEPDNRNRGRTNRLDAAAGICNRRSFDFEDDAREYVRSRSHFCGDNGPDSLGYYLTDCHFLREGKSPAPHLNPLPASGERRIRS